MNAQLIERRLKMEETIQTEKKAFYKKKLFLIPMFGILLMGMVFAASIIYETINVDITVDEALSVSSAMPISIAGTYAGETVTSNITIQNDADVPLYTTLAWAEGTNVNLVTYTEGGALSGIQTLAPGANTLTVSWTIDEDSTTGTFDGTITLSRVAAP